MIGRKMSVVPFILPLPRSDYFKLKLGFDSWTRYMRREQNHHLKPTRF